MKDIIIEALDNTFNSIIQKTPKTKMTTDSVSIEDVNPLDIPTFMKDLNIPDDAYFDGTANGYDGWIPGDIKLSWDFEIPTTEADNKKFMEKRFSGVSSKNVYNILITNGYKRINGHSSRFLEFRDNSIYDMYLKKDFDKLVKFYSLVFTKIKAK